MDHKAAFRCNKCPRNNDPERGPSCPAWWEFSQTNVTTGEERIQRTCGWQAMPSFMIEVIKAANAPAAAIESTRNEIAAGFSRVAGVMAVGLQPLNVLSLAAPT